MVPNCLQRTHTGFAKRGKKTFLSFFLFVYLFCSLQSSLEISVRGAECQGFANCEVLYSGGFCGLRASSSYPGSFRPSLLRSEREAWLETTSPGGLCKRGGCPGVWPPAAKEEFIRSFIHPTVIASPPRPGQALHKHRGPRDNDLCTFPSVETGWGQAGEFRSGKSQRWDMEA